MNGEPCPIRAGCIASVREIGRRIQDARHRLGWSTTDLSTCCGELSVTQLERIEAGSRKGVTLHEAVALAYALRVDLHALVYQEQGQESE